MCGGPVGDIVDLGGDILEGAGDIVEGGLEFVGDTVDTALENPLETAALVAMAVYAPELLPEMMGEAAATETGLATLGESVLPAAEAFGTGAGTVATDAALAAGAGASGTAAADMAISGLGEVPMEFGDQFGDFPLEGSYGSPTAPGVQEATQNLLDTNALQELTGSPLDVLGDQPGDFPTEGNYGNPTAPGVQDAVQNLLDANAAQAASGLSLSDVQNAYRGYNLANQLLGGGAAMGGLSMFPNLTGGTTGGSTATAGIPNLTPGLTRGETNFELVGEPEPVRAAAGGYMDYTSGYNTTDTDAQKLRPTLTKANAQFTLTGMPVQKADGGIIEHNPEFFSEGGLSMAHRYVKGGGDGTSDSVPAMLATGEFVIPADVVSSLGNGDNDSGAEVLDEFLSTIRKHKRAADSKELPPDSKGALEYLQEAYHKAG